MSTNRAVRYDPRFNSWFEITPMLERRCSLALVVSHQDKCFYAIGGLENRGWAVSTVEFYDICGAAPSWS